MLLCYSKIRRRVAVCANCEKTVPLNSLNLSLDRPGIYVCPKCANVVAVKWGKNRVVSPAQALRLDWNPRMTARAKAFGIWRRSECHTKKEHLTAKMLFLIAQEEEMPFNYGSESGHRAMVALNEAEYLGYLLWSDHQDSSTGKPEPVLRQLFVRPEFRRTGIGKAMVQSWADQFAFPIADSFGVESPNADARRMLIGLEYAREDEGDFVGTKCHLWCGTTACEDPMEWIHNFLPNDPIA